MQEKPIKNLYARLIETDSLNESLGRIVKETNHNLEQFKGMRGYKDISIPASEVPKIDVESVQKGIFEEYKGNSILQNAISGCKSIEQTVDELALINKGIKRFLPHRKNKEHNQKYEELCDLIPAKRQLKTDGLFDVENFVNNAVFFTGISFAAGIGISLMDPNANGEMMNSIVRCYLPGGLSVFFSYTGFTYNAWRKNATIDTKEYAHYLDQKIESLYKVEARHLAE